MSIELEKINFGEPLWNEPLDRNLAALNKGKADTADAIPELMTITLTNTDKYPFNNSEQTISLKEPRKSLDYRIHAEVVSHTGSVGEVEIYDKQLNGFKLAFTGSGTQAVIKCYIVGGFA